MYDKYHLSRCDAMEWLAEHYPVFPASMPVVPMRVEWCSENLFKGWAFIISLIGTLAFADCLSLCNPSEDMEGFRLTEYRFDLSIRRITNPHPAVFFIRSHHARQSNYLAIVGIMALSAISSLIHMSEGLLWLICCGRV